MLESVAQQSEYATYSIFDMLCLVDAIISKSIYLVGSLGELNEDCGFYVSWIRYEYMIQDIMRTFHVGWP